MKAKILNLKPTQFAVGMDEVDHRIKEMQAMSASELHKYLIAHKVPVVRGKDGLYLVDRHHLVRALWEMGHEHVHVIIKADLRKKRNFWQEMFNKNWVYLVDQFGTNHHWTEQLPRNIKCMADNPWRSLAWKVRLEGGFEKSTEPFAEFRWAEYFRRCHKYLHVHDVDTAVMLCQSPMAKRLPGYKYGK
jgi:hypothetical protein